MTSDAVLTNPSRTSVVEGTMDLFDDAGLPFPISFAWAIGSRRASSAKSRLLGTSSVDFSIPPRGAVTLSTGVARAGAAVVTSNGVLGGVVRFSLPGVGIAGVGVSQLLEGFIVPVRRKAAGINSGIAIHNPGSDPINVRLTLRNDRGIQQGDSALRPLAAQGHLARYIDELFPGVDTRDFVGTLEGKVEGEGEVAATALELGPEPGQFTTLSVSPLL